LVESSGPPTGGVAKKSALQQLSRRNDWLAVARLQFATILVK
jgi:hypothetical protein